MRFDFNLSESHKLTARWSYLRSSEDNSPSRGRSVTDIYADNGKYKLDDKTHSLALQLTSVFGNNGLERIHSRLRRSDGSADLLRPAVPHAVYRHQRDRTRRTPGRRIWSSAPRNFGTTISSAEVLSRSPTTSPCTAGPHPDLRREGRPAVVPESLHPGRVRRVHVQLHRRGSCNDQTPHRVHVPLLRDGRPAAGGKLGRESSSACIVQDEWTVTPTLKVTGGRPGRYSDLSRPPELQLRHRFDIWYRTDTPPKTTLAFSPRVGFNWCAR